MPEILPAHEFANVFPPLSDVELAELADDIKANGLRSPIVAWRARVLDGRNRMLACALAGVEPVVEEREFKSDADALRFVISQNLKRRHLTDGQRAMLATKLADMPAGRPSRDDLRNKFTAAQAGEAVGVSAASVRAAKRVKAKGAPELQQAVSSGAVGVQAAAKVAGLPEDQQREIVAEKGAQSATRAGLGLDSDEWYTSPEIIEQVRAVFGGSIDLDPCSCEAAQRVVQAERWFDKETNGLEQDWAGRAFMNPPFSMPLVEHFTDKMIAALDSGDVTESIVLVNSATDTHWFHKLLRSMSRCCLVEGRLSFWRPDYAGTKNRNGQAVFYSGKRLRQFRDVFGEIGTVVRVAGLVG